MTAANHKIRVALVALALLAHPGSAQSKQAELVIDRVTVVDVRTGTLKPDRAIFIADGRIVRIAAAGSVSRKTQAERIDGKGAYVVPGYNDMHVHNLNSASPETSLPLMLANGITGIRQMAPMAPLFPVDASGKPKLPADSPSLLAMPGPILAGPAFGTPVAAATEVARQKAQGADFIKLVDLPEPAFLAATDAAEAEGLPISGHLPASVDPREAIANGFDSIEHLGPTISLLLSCSTEEAPIRAAMRAIPSSGSAVNFSQDPAILARVLANPILLTPPQGFGVIQRVLATYSDEKCEALARDIAASRTWVVPTLTRLEAMNLGNTSELRDNPDLRFVPGALRSLWRDVGTDFETRLSQEQRDILARLDDRQRKLLTLFDRAGVKMLAGTDFGGQWIVPGRSLHREFDLLAGAGLSPIHILRMTTINAATYLGREQDMGSVEAGKRADLVLLAGNPLDSAANLHRIDAVVKDGRFLSRASLDEIEAREAAVLK